ncbi:MAG TPA: MFS transporter [Allosphingosinicella sp.]|nr:MFS transporter [Allosphingosinicella sp.]
MFNRPLNPWWSVVAGFFGSAVGAGTIMVYVYGQLAVAMAAEFAWSREVIARNLTAFLIGSGVGTITLGWLISRLGIRRPAALMAGICGLLFASVPWLPRSFPILTATFLLIGFFGAACNPMPYSVAISGFFDKKRGLALGLVVAGAGAGATVGPRIAQYLLDEHGWRAGFAVIGLGAALIAVIGLAFLVRTPPGVVKSASVGGPEPRSAADLFLFNGDFWRIAVPIIMVSVAAFGGLGSLVPLFRDAHLSPAVIAGALSFAGFCSWIGRVVVGYLLDKVFAPLVCAAVFAGAGSGLLLLTTGAAPFQVYAGAALLAMALGCESDLVTYLVSRYFRLVDYSRVVGMLWVVWAWGGGLGAFLADRSFGILGSYHYAFYAFVAMLAVGILVVLTLGPYRQQQNSASVR